MASSDYENPIDLRRDLRKSPNQVSEQCVICFGSIIDKAFVDGCFHYFCFICISSWIKKKAVCPLCLRAVDSVIMDVKSADQYKIVKLDELLQNYCNIHSASSSSSVDGTNSIEQMYSDSEDSLQNENQLENEVPVEHHEQMDEEYGDSEESDQDYDEYEQDNEEPLGISLGSLHPFAEYEPNEPGADNYSGLSENSEEELEEEDEYEVQSQNGYDSQYSFEEYEPDVEPTEESDVESEYLGYDEFDANSDEESHGSDILQLYSDQEEPVDLTVDEPQELIYSSDQSGYSDEQNESNGEVSENDSDYLYDYEGSQSEADNTPIESDENSMHSDYSEYYESNASHSSEASEIVSDSSSD